MPSKITDFSTGLEKGILERVMKNPGLRYKDILSEFGDYSAVHNTIKNMIIKNQIYFLPADDSFDNPIIKTPNPALSEWDTMNAEPCFTCPYIDECSIGNESRNPVTCQEFNDWIDEEVQLREEEVDDF